MFWFFGHEACGILVPRPGIEPAPSASEGEVLTTEPPGEIPNWCFWTVVLEKTLESPLDCKIQPVHTKEISPEYSLEGLMLKL